MKRILKPTAIVMAIFNLLMVVAGVFPGSAPLAYAGDELTGPTMVSIPLFFICVALCALAAMFGGIFNKLCENCVGKLIDSAA